MTSYGTQGPWQLWRQNHGGINGARILGGENADVIVARLTHDADKSITDKEADAELILAAVNACFQICPDRPKDFAEEIPEVVYLLRWLVELKFEAKESDPDRYVQEKGDAWKQARALLSRLGIEERKG